MHHAATPLSDAPVPAAAVALARGVNLVRFHERCWLVDMRRGRFFCADEVGTDLITRLLRESADEAVSGVARDYSAPREAVDADARRLIDELQRRGLLARYGPRSQHPAPPGRLALAVLLSLAWLCFRLLGWSATIALWGRLARCGFRPRRHRDRAAVLAGVDRVLRTAASRHPLNTECKERALVGWWLLAHRYGIGSDLVVGTQPYPFLAHAWIECGGSTLSDDRAHCASFVPVARYPLLAKALS
jgi:hypothetical protein